MSEEVPSTLLFTDASVRAVRAGHKTVTRRLVAVPPEAVLLTQGPVRGQWQASFEGIPRPIRGRVGLPGRRVLGLEAWRRDETGALRWSADASPAERAAVRWRSPLHLRRAEARLSFRLVSLRVERLHALTAEEALAEGVRLTVDPEGHLLVALGGPGAAGPYLPPGRAGHWTQAELLRASFAALWDSLHRRRAPWASDRWVLRIELAPDPSSLLP